MHIQFSWTKTEAWPCHDVWISSPESTMKSKTSFLTLSNCHSPGQLQHPSMSWQWYSTHTHSLSLSLFSSWFSCLLCAARWECRTASSRARPGWGGWCTGKLVPVLLSPKLTRKYSDLLRCSGENKLPISLDHRADGCQIWVCAV